MKHRLGFRCKRDANRSIFLHEAFLLSFGTLKLYLAKTAGVLASRGADGHPVCPAQKWGVSKVAALFCSYVLEYVESPETKQPQELFSRTQKKWFRRALAGLGWQGAALFPSVVPPRLLCSTSTRRRYLTLKPNQMLSLVLQRPTSLCGAHIPACIIIYHTRRKEQDNEENAHHRTQPCLGRGRNLTA